MTEHRSDIRKFLITSLAWLNYEKQFYLCQFYYIDIQAYLGNKFNHQKLRYTEPCHSVPNVHWWSLTFYISWIHHPFIRQRQLSLPLYNAQPTWLSLTNERKLYALLSLVNVNLLLLSIKCTLVCEEQPCRVHKRISTVMHSSCTGYGPLTRYAKLQVAHAPGMPGTFSSPPTSKEIFS